MDSEYSDTYTAFSGHCRVATGAMPVVAEALAQLPPDGPALLVFRDRDGALVDTPLSPAQAALWRGRSALVAAAGPGPAPAPAVGRPRLGVVAREVTLLPRHWEWLAAQRGGASAALRRLVDEARRANAGRDDQHAATERAYRFMSAIASNLPDFEEASRALFAHDGAAFAERIEVWPADVRAHLAWLARGAFEAVAEAGGGR